MKGATNGATKGATARALRLPQSDGEFALLHCIEPGMPRPDVVLFVHGASFPTMLASGYEFSPGDSWLQAVADRGCVACGLDFVGFGSASRPHLMQSAVANPASESFPTRAVAAATQIASAVEQLRTRYAASRIHVVAHSWGTIPAARYAARNPDALATLTLFGPIVPKSGASATLPRNAGWSIRAIDRYEQLRYREVLPPGMDLLDPGLQGRWPEEFAESASLSGCAAEIRIPSGPLADIAMMQGGQYPFDPGQVRVPVLLVYGAHDTETKASGLEEYVARFGSVAPRWRVELDPGSHVMHLERNRKALYNAVAAFVETFSARVPANQPNRTGVGREPVTGVTG